MTCRKLPPKAHPRCRWLRLESATQTFLETTKTTMHLAPSSHPLDSLFVLEKGLCETAAMSVQVVAAKMAEVELKDVLTGKDAPVGSPVTPTSEGKSLARSEASSSAASSPIAESSAKAGESSLGLLTPNPVKMPQGSAMKRPDPQQNGGEAFVNRDGTVAEAPRMKKVGETTWMSAAAVPSMLLDHHVAHGSGSLHCATMLTG